MKKKQQYDDYDESPPYIIGTGSLHDLNQDRRRGVETKRINGFIRPKGREMKKKCV